MSLFTIFAGLSIFIGCLGLFGLSAFTINQRVKEIGIRKVLGAKVNSIVLLLSTEFLKLIGLSAIIAFPLAGYAMTRWLEEFAYRISLPWWVFIVAALIAFATISLQAIKVALANPIRSLRNE